MERFSWINQQGWLNHVFVFDNNALAMNIAMSKIPCNGFNDIDMNEWQLLDCSWRVDGRRVSLI